MGKQLKLREAQRREAEQALAARLRAHAGTKTGPAFITSYSEFDPEYRARIDAYRGAALRAPEGWRCRLRVRSPERRFLELVQYTFARYSVAQHLENAWIAGLGAPVEGIEAASDGREGEDAPDFCRWYIAVAQGRSLYKEAAHRCMTRLEAHHFTNAPGAVGSARHAIWYAFARANGADTPTALRVARTKLTGLQIESPFWKQAARFFAQNPTSILEMNDLIDFFRAMRQQDACFSLAGRSLPALRRRLTLWHRALRDIACDGQWNGCGLDDTEYWTGSGLERALWYFRQIKSGRDLALEGEIKRHCVATYRHECVSGAVSIWSLTREFADGRSEAGVTIELRRDRAIIQCRGFANRPPNAEEIEVVKRWARQFGLRWPDLEG